MSLDPSLPAEASPPPAVHVSAASKSFGNVTALRGVDLRVEPGQTYGVLGPNGAGKTTLLRILLGLVRADEGDVSVLGARPGDSSVLHKVGALIETPAFIPHLTGYTNLRILAKARGLPDSEVRRVLEIVHLENRADERYRGYSLGMGQRLGVAAALLGRPPLLILDEPTNGLDPEGVVSMRKLIRDLGARGTTVLLSSHVLSEVQQLCERVVVLDRGSVIAEDAVEALRTGPGSTTLALRADPQHRARSIACAFLGEARITPVPPGADGEIHVQIDAADVPDLVRALVGGGVDVHEVTPQRQSLEDVFFELTRPPATQEQS